MLDQQIKQFQEQIQSIDMKLIELSTLKQALQDMPAIKEKSEILTPISNGVFIKAKVQKTDKLLINVGNNVVVEKTLKESQILLDKKFNEVESLRNESLSEMEKLIRRAQEVEKSLKENV